jgi:hypothetical protein
MSKFQDRLRHASVHSPVESGGLQVFGLKIEEPSSLRYQTLDEALGTGLLEVTEISEGGSVPTLRLVNRSDSRVFLMAGEQLVGAKQNRVLNTSIMVDRHSEMPIPVSCVEQRRWSYRSAQFSSSGLTSHHKLRRELSESVTTSFHSTGRPGSDQSRVWSEVHRKLSSMGSNSETMAMEKAYEDTRPILDGMLRTLTAPAGCCGAVFAIQGKIVGMDLFDQPQTLAKLWDKLIRGYAIDALEHRQESPQTTTADTVRTWLGTLDTLQDQAFPSPGIGEDVRLQGGKMSGSSLRVESWPVHTQVFTGV